MTQKKPSFSEIQAQLTAPGQMFETERVKIRGVDVTAWKHAPRTLRQVFEGSRRFGDRVYMVYEGELLTFDEHYRLVVVLANALVKNFGVRKGDRVALAMRNYPEWSIAFWAIAAIGAVVVPLNAWWTGPELAYGLNDSGARVLIADDDRARRLAREVDLARLDGVIVARGGQLDSTWSGFDQTLAREASSVALPDGTSPGPEDPATIFYTSGTTGAPKGALGTQRNMCSMAVTLGFLGVRSLLREGGSLQDLGAMQSVQQVMLLAVPLFHVVGSHGILLNALVAGSKIVMLYKWDAQQALEYIEREKVTVLTATPTMIWQLVDHPDIATRDLSSVRAVSYGGAPAPPELRRRVADLMPGALAGTGYGITEVSSVVSGLHGSDYGARPDSAGVVVPINEVIAVDDAGDEVPCGELGELWIRGANVVTGYWNKPDATAQSFTNGWFHSGDIGRIDAEGFIYIVDRKKDMIIRGGENVYCAEVEAALMDHPAVKGAAVFGLPHRVLGEEVGAVVQVDPAQGVTPADLQQHAGKKLAAFKVPTRVWLRTEPMPLGATGKIMKRELREQVLAAP